MSRQCRNTLADREEKSALYYQIADIVFESEIVLPSFENFKTEPKPADVSLVISEEDAPHGTEVRSSYIIQHKIDGGWFYHAVFDDQMGLVVSEDYKKLKLVGQRTYSEQEAEDIGFDEEYSLEEVLIRMALECLLVRHGYVSLHSACIQLEDMAIAFSGPSGTGKSTRAEAWKEAFGAELISGDRPLINVRNLEVYGVPWDGKEKCFRNVHYPLNTIIEVRRSEKSNYIREMSYEQKRRLLYQECFIPMWDIETAVIQMTNIAKLASRAKILRGFSGPDPESAVELRKALEAGKYKKEKTDMKAKGGFVLRNIAGEQILMPTDENIGKFKGTVLLSGVAAFIWEKMQAPVSRDDLLTAVLDEYEVEESVAAKDLDNLLTKLDEYGVIEKD